MTKGKNCPVLHLVLIFNQDWNRVNLNFYIETVWRVKSIHWFWLYWDQIQLSLWAKLAKISMNLQSCSYMVLNFLEMFFFFYWSFLNITISSSCFLTRVHKASSLVNVFLCKLTMVLLTVDTSLKFTVVAKYLWIAVHNCIKSHGFLFERTSAHLRISLQQQWI